MLGQQEVTPFFFFHNSRDRSEFDPHLKLWLTCNHKPNVRDDSHGFWRRVHVIPFTRRFDGKKQDKQLLEKLKAEAPGIFRWLVQGCRQWREEGLNPPLVVLEGDVPVAVEI